MRPIIEHSALVPISRRWTIRVMASIAAVAVFSAARADDRAGQPEQPAETEPEETESESSSASSHGEVEAFRQAAEEQALRHLKSRVWRVRKNGLYFLESDVNKLTDEDWEQLLHLRSVTELRLSGNSFTDDHIKYLAGMESLEELVLADTLVTAEGLKQLKNLPRPKPFESNAAVDHVSKLKRLSLHGRNVDDGYLIQISEFKNLEYLGLGRTSITDDGLIHVTELPRLKRLNLRSTRITDEGLAHVKKLPRLEFLNLQETRVTNEGLVRHLVEVESLRQLIHPDPWVHHTVTAELQRSLPKVFIPFDVPP